MTLLHIFAGSLGLFFGALALYAVKGGKFHRWSGMVFVVAMLAMSSSAIVLATYSLRRDSFVAGQLTFYLVLTSLFSVRRFSQLSVWTNVAVSFIGLAAAFFGIKYGLEGTLLAVGGTNDKAVACLIFGNVALVSVIGDIRMMLSKEFGPKQRLIRHLWRMCFAMLLAAAAFFLGQSQVFPLQIRSLPLLVMPVLLIAIVTIYWVIRTKFRKPKTTTNTNRITNSI